MKFVIWGAGERGRHVSSLLHRDEVKYFVDIDKNKIGRFINGIQVKSIDYILKETDQIQVIYTVKNDTVLDYLKKWGGEFYYIEDYFSKEIVVQNIDSDLWDKYSFDKQYVKYTYYETREDNWFREDWVSDVNNNLIEALKRNDEECVRSILQSVYKKNELYIDELYENRPGMRLAKRIIDEYTDKLIVADYACGHGELIKKLAKEGHETYAVDYSPTRVDELRNCGVNASVGDVQRLEYSSNMFDVIICMECLEHVGDVIAARNEIRRTLKSGGIAIVTVPYMKNCESNFHVRQFDYAKLMALFKDDFEIENLISVPYLNWTYDDNLFIVARKLERGNSSNEYK